MSQRIMRMIAPFWGWTDFTPAVPDLYWNVYSAEERIKKLCCELHKLCEYANMLGENINLDHDAINGLQEQFEKFIESGFDDYYKDEIDAWIDDNLEVIFERYTRGIYFGLNLDGHFVAYIPESWSDIVFDTGADYTLDTYGRLILRMDVDSPYDRVDQTPEVVRPYSDAELELKVRNIMNTLYSTNGGA